jgi:adenine-specific DNA-methyltransferase
MSTLENQRLIKLKQAKEILTALGLPVAQCKERSAWVLLALANIKPNNNWTSSQSPLLPTVDIMQFIRKEYGQDYKPNSRETIRRQTLHQFEQAQLVCRNRDNPARATNSKNNNYSLNQEVIEILHNYPNGNWQDKIAEFKQKHTALLERYNKTLDKHKIPITLPNGKIIKLSPGKHNQLHASIINEFCSRFIGKNGKLLYVGDTASSRNEGGKLMHLEKTFLNNLGVSSLKHGKLPDIIVYDENKQWLFLIEAVTSHGPISPKRQHELQDHFKNCTARLIYVTAFLKKADFKKHIIDIAWETEVWIAETPDHMIHFNGDRFLGPY